MALKILGVVLVLALGVAGGYFLRPPVEQWLTGRGEVEASVIEERREEDRLVLALRSGDQTMMATFRERIDDIAELVDVGDVVTLHVGGHGVFADDVPIVRVQRPPPPPPSRRRRRSEEAEEGAEGTAADEHAAGTSGEHASDEHASEAHASEVGEANATGASEEHASGAPSEETPEPHTAEPARAHGHTS